MEVDVSLVKDKVRVSTAQIVVEHGNLEKNMRNIKRRIDEAADNGAELVVFPETAHHGYIYDTFDEGYSQSTPVPGPITDQICDKARENSIYVVIGVAERLEYLTVYNSGILIGPKGDILGIYRKNFITMTDKKWQQPGDTGCPVFKTPIGNISIFICGDGRVPEIARLEALNGADIICGLEAWFSRDMYIFNKPSRAIENGIWLIESDRPKSEEYPMIYPGHSFIMDPRGNMIAEASEDKEEIIYADIAPKEARNKKIGLRNDLFKDRRPELYRLLTTPVKKLPLTKILDTPVVPRKMTINTFAIQTYPVFKNPQANLESILPRIQRAAAYYGKLIVLPELFMTGCAFKKAEEAEKVAEGIKGRTVSEISKITSSYKAYVAFSMIEKDGGKLFNTAVLVGPNGVVGKYRKTHLWNMEKLWCTPGDIEYPVFETEFGNVGMMVGYDGFFPEVTRILMLKGADVVAWPCSWTSQLYPVYLCPVRAYETRVFLVAADRIGKEGDERYIGQSMLVDPNGVVLAKASADKEDHFFRKIDLALARSKEIQINVDTHFHRRPGMYKAFTKENLILEFTQ
ncbi:MAG: carbon-nitrogen hydrolase family protein [Candidatus Bathyarchaeota archaeon]